MFAGWPTSLGATLLALSMTVHAETPPEAEISNGTLVVKFYLPNAKTGFYRGTRFDWSGVIYSLQYQGHNYYGPWFTKTAPKVHDFIYDGPEIVAGPCSAITGPVDEFSTGEKALGYDQAPAGGTFLKIGVGVLRKPNQSEYDKYVLYDIVDSGKWTVHQKPDSIEFIQEVSDPLSGYGYLYTKTVTLAPGKPEMTIRHQLKNIGKRPIESNVYDHNFLVLDNQPTGPDFQIKLPFDFKTEAPLDPKFAEKQGHVFAYRKLLQGHDTVAATFLGYGGTPADYNISIDNRKVGMGMKVSGDRPLASLSLWSIRSVLAMEPYIDMSIAPGQEFVWTYTYTYYAVR
jgi:hypothetical protein